jgi:hypothetical protein
VRRQQTRFDFVQPAPQFTGNVLGAGVLVPSFDVQIGTQCSRLPKHDRTPAQRPVSSGQAGSVVQAKPMHKSVQCMVPGMTTEGGTNDSVRAVQDDISKLRMTTGSKEPDSTAQELGRVGSILGDLDRRVRKLEAERGTRPDAETQ